MKNKNSNFNMILILAGVCLISAGILGLLYSETREKIEQNRQKRIEKSVYEVIPGIDSYEGSGEDIKSFKGKKGDHVVGYAVLTEGMGFQGEIELIVGVASNMRSITGVRVLDSVETPGLGNKIASKEFLNQFDGLKIPRQKGIEVEAITGATISSQSVQRIINEAIEDAKRIH